MQKLSGRNPKRLRNCAGEAQKGSETVREEPKKAQKLSGRSPKRLRNCPGGALKGSETVREPKNAKKAQKLSGRSPKKAQKLSGAPGGAPKRKLSGRRRRNCPEGAKKRLSETEAQKCSGKGSKKLRNGSGEAKKRLRICLTGPKPKKAQKWSGRSQTFPLKGGSEF